MGSLTRLEDIGYKAHLLQATSDLVNMYVYDRLRTRYNVHRESVIEVNSKRTVEIMEEYASMSPLMSDKWLFMIDALKVKSYLARVAKIVNSRTETSIFLIRTEKYKDFKDVKEKMPRVNDMYMSFIRAGDVNHLLARSGFTPTLKKFVANSYGYSPGLVIQLALDLERGEEVSTQREVIALLGSSAGTTTAYAMKLCGDIIKSEKSRNILMKKRLEAGRELCKSFGSFTLRNYLLKTIRDIQDVKELHMTAEIYDRIRDLPEGFDEKQLAPYNRYLPQITEFAFHRILWLNKLLSDSGPWHSDSDFQNFIYTVYGRDCDVPS